MTVSCVPDGVVGATPSGHTALDLAIPAPGDYPVRSVNRTLDLPTLAGCGRAYAPCDAGDAGVTPVFWDGERYRARLASCNSTMLCDHCAPREQAASRERWRWQFEHWLGAQGGQLVHLRLGAAHRAADDAAVQLAVLSEAFEAFRDLAVWRRLGAVDYVRVLHPGSFSARFGWGLHFHVVVFVRAGHRLELDGLIPELQEAWAAKVDMAWGDRVWRSARRRTSRKGGLFARVFSSALDALYAWHWADDDGDRYQPNADHYPQDHLDGPSYEPDHELGGEPYAPEWGEDPGERYSMWDVARAAAHSRRAWVKWRELVHAVSGRHVVACSDMLDRVWARHLEELDAAGEPVVASVGLGAPEFQVGNKLVSRAAAHGQWDRALVFAGSRRRQGLSGADALAEFLSSVLGCEVFVDLGCEITRVWADDIGPPGGRRPPRVSYVVGC